MTQIACLPLTQRPTILNHCFAITFVKHVNGLTILFRKWKRDVKEMMRRMWPNNVRELANATELFTVGVLPLAETAKLLMHVGTPDTALTDEWRTLSDR